MKSLEDAIRETTKLHSEALSDSLQLDLTVFSETFQHTGSFKFRAAYNVASSVPNETLLTASSGNFGQALAYACKLLKKRCIVVMPDTSAQVKVDAVRSHGAEVHLIDVSRISRADKVKELGIENPEAYVASAYDDPLVIRGNATLGIEIARKGNVDVLIAPVGGGGLISGISTGLCEEGSLTKLFGAEPLLGNDAFLSMQKGLIVANEAEPQTLADGARTLSLGKHNWEIIRNGVEAIFEVDEEALKSAVRDYFSFLNLKVEPTGALTLAALKKNSDAFKNKRVGIVVSGGNVDPGVYAEILRN